jgi:hypothetical protein
MGKAQGLLGYVVNQAEFMKQTASNPAYSYKNADYHLAIYLQNIQTACRDINLLLEECKALLDAGVRQNRR